MAVAQQHSGMATAGGVGIVFDSNGVAKAPRRPYTLIEDWGRSFRNAWASLDELNEALQYAPKAEGLPEGAPDPNVVYAEGGLVFRYVIDPEVKREPFVARNEDGTEEVRERVQFRKQFVALTLEGAQMATDKRNAEAGEPETDFWCGFTWIRGGYSPERWAPTEVSMLAVRNGGPTLVFDQAASPTDAARIRHEVAHMDRTAPTLPVESAGAQRRRGRPSKPTPPDSTADDASSAED